MKAQEITKGHSLTIFDIDDTLFHTTAKIKVINQQTGQIKSLTNQEFNTYERKPNEVFDFGEFRNAEKFRQESIPIRPMIAKLKSILNKTTGKVIMLTARADFDDREKFLDLFRSYGIDMSKVHVHRAGNLITPESPAEKKAVFVRQYLNSGLYSRVRLYDDSMKNLVVFKNLKTEYPNVDFRAYYVGPEGNTSTVEGFDMSKGTGSAAIKGADNVISPVGSVPKSQRK